MTKREAAVNNAVGDGISCEEKICPFFKKCEVIEKNGFGVLDECKEFCKQWLKDNPEEVIVNRAVFSDNEIKDNDMIEKLNQLMSNEGYKTTHFMYDLRGESVEIKIKGERK